MDMQILFFVCVLCIGQVVDLAISGRTGLDFLLFFPLMSLQCSAHFSIFLIVKFV